MAAQWGDSRYPPFAPADSYPPNSQPYNDPRRQYVQPPPFGFYNPAVASPPQPGYPVGPSSLPVQPIAIPTPSIPSILRPGSGGAYRPVNRTSSRADIGDLFFGGVPSFPVPEFPGHLPQPTHRPSLVAPPLNHTVSAPPPLPRKPDFSQPPLPPKPSYTPPLPTAPPALNGYSQFQQQLTRPPPPLPAPINEEEDFRRAIEQSTLDARARKQQEDEELARAMQESLRVNSHPSTLAGGDGGLSSSPTSYNFPVSAPALYTTPSGYFGSPERMSLPLSDPSTPGPRSRANSAKQVSDDEAMARRLVKEEIEEARARKQQERLVKLREEDARRLREEQEQMRKTQQDKEEAMRAQEQQPQSPMSTVHSKARMDGPVQVHRVVNPDDGLPQYTDIIHNGGPSTSAIADMQKKRSTTNLTRPHSASASSPSSARRPYPSHDSSPNLPHAPVPGIYRSSSASAVPNQLLDPSLISDTRTGRHPSFSDSAASRPSSNASSPTEPTSAPSRSPLLSRPSLSHPLPSVQEGNEDSKTEVLNSSNPQLGHSQSVTSPGPSNESVSSPTKPPPPPVAPVRSSQFISPELLHGLTMGFGPPVITPQMEPYKEQLPDVITLPYGRSPPLHIKAPNWWKLVRLMALMSETRIEPNIEAQAAVKTAMHLRVVINFVKLHATSLDWHVILYLTIDLSVPNDQRYNKYRNLSDPSVLPFSYTLSPTPTHLREAADSPLQKWYSIPSTGNKPSITLPVSFPDLAQYLISAVEESRRAVSDRTTSMGRLAKCIDTFYPNKSSGGGPIGAHDDEREEESVGFRGRLGKFFGIGHGGQAERPANDERAALVTPFLADNYGR
ncbi:hypothetical protein BDY19DRAFT_134737 [Irpex rosettiformis]|uniref:Uncharacterized protein n=1 Tax=Irpex rosettiformis TaxID=378272 RepID=A0ACB8U4Y0_9APHY|nr:hypothetical protein BDY19DRAFT_134737 [Irpex rosettiformis]